MTAAEIRQQAVAEYLEGLEFRKQGARFSNESLAAKFQRSVRTVIKILDGQVTHVPDDEAQLILECAAERSRCKELAAARTRSALGKKYGVSATTISYWVVGNREASA